MYMKEVKNNLKSYIYKAEIEDKIICFHIYYTNTKHK